MSNSTGHGLPQMAKPDNLFLLFLWIIFFFVAFGGGCFMMYQAIDQFLQYGVITTINIKRESEITMPAITFCAYYNPQDMILNCTFADDPNRCKMTKLTIFNKYGIQENCVQLNHGTNVTELVRSTGEDWEYGYKLDVYLPYDFFHFDITDNNAKPVDDDVHHEIFGGQSTKISLSKTVQTLLGQPHSDCNQASEYRQVNCEVDCLYKNLSEACGCAYPTECGSYFENDWTKECKEAFDKKAASIRSQCSLNCPLKCNQVYFEINRLDIEYEFEGNVDDAKGIVSKKFNILRLTNDQFKKRLTKIYFYYSKLETTKITQSPSMTLTKLIANVGGLLGKSL